MNILHLEDSPEDAELVRTRIEEEWPSCVIVCVATRQAFVTELQRPGHDLILSDFNLQSIDGLEALKLAKEYSPDTPFIFLSGTIGEDRAIDALQSGAQDYILKDGMKRLVPAIDRALRDHDERKQRRQAELRIREQAEMLNQAREAIFVTDLSNRLTYWNAGAERLFGWRADEVLGRTTDHIFDSTVTVNIQTAREETLSKGEWSGEFRTHNRSRQSLIVESRQTLIRDDSGNPKARLWINSDITDRKRLEEQFLRAQRMENIGLLAAGIAHDLNNMLAPILLAAPMLKEHVNDSGALALLSTLEKSAERGANLVRQILSFAHGATGEHRLMQVRHVLHDISSVMGGTFPKSIRLEDYVPSDLWPIEGNPTQIHQVVLNLCVNARDAMPNGGTLRLRAENRELGLSVADAIERARPGHFVVLIVEDTGTGIPPEVVARMWEPFFTTKEAGKGTGLGLSTARGIIENHNGFVELTTAPGRGTSFKIYLPAAEGIETEQLSPSARTVPQGKGELILVVDDESNIREMTFTMLTRNRYRVIVAADGAEAAALFAQRAAEIRLVITDIHMPNLDGATLGRALRRIKPTTKLLVMSGMASALTNRPNHTPEEFADAFLHKPFKPETLLTKVHELLRGTEGASGAPWPMSK
jgi:two-component system, cell cycle sensor histidine kinase and response regulator CckA